MISSQKPQVLFVEDDEIDQMALARSFEADDTSFNYTIVGSVQEAKEKLMEEKYDIVIIDFLLGDGTAFDVLKDIGDIPSILVTGRGSVEIAVEAMKAGASDYLIKEPNHSHLLTLTDSISSIIKNHQAEQKARMLSQAIQLVSDSVYITDMHRKIVYVNQAFQDVFGYREKEILEKSSDLLAAQHEEDSPLVLKKRKDGTEFAVSLSQAVVKNQLGHGQFIINVIRERKD